MQKKLLCLLVVSLFFICLPRYAPELTASAATVPDDDVNGTYAQVIDGDWVVSKNTNLSDEVVLMNGNVQVNQGATLTLTNTTIIFNVTSDGQYGLSVRSGATLRLLDRDGKSKTSKDGCLITDTTHDVDNGGAGDLYYNLYFEQDSKIYIQNSIVEEFTKKSGYNTVSLSSDVVFFSGSTFRSAGNCFFISRIYKTPSLVVIDNCLFENGTKFLDVSGFDAETPMKITNNTFMNSHDPVEFLQSNDLIISNNTFVNCSGLYLGYDSQVRVEGDAFTGIQYQGLYIEGCTDCLVKDVNLKDSLSGIRIYSSRSLVLENVTVYNITSNNLDVNSQSSYVVMRNSSFKKSGGNNIYLSNACLYGYNIDIGTTGDNNCAYVTESQMYMMRARTLGTNGITLVHSQGWLLNSTLGTSSWQFDVGKSSSMTAVNTSFNLSKVSLFPGGDVSSRGNLNVGYFLQTNVTDPMGIVYGAQVTAKNKFGTTAATAITDRYGHTLFALINRTHYHDGFTPRVDYYGPYTVSSLIQGLSKTAAKTPAMDRNDYVNIAYNPINTPPSKPFNMKASIVGASINITWEHYCPDYWYFNVYRNNTAGAFVLKYSSLGKPDQAKRYWKDANAAVNQSTYRYIVKIVDTIGQEGQNTDVVQNGDWVVSGKIGNQSVSDMDIRLNGTLYIVDGGKLTLKNVTLRFDNPGGICIHVMSGALKTQDRDSDPKTAGDNCKLLSYAIKTNLTTTKTTQLVIMADQAGKVEFRDTALSDLGRPWASDIYSNVNGIYLASDGNVIDGCSFEGSVVPVTAADAQGLRISNCTVKGSHEFAFKILRSADVVFYNNTVWGANQNALYMEHTDRVSLFGNHINSTKGNSVNLWDCDDVAIWDNEITRGKTGQDMIYASQASDYIIYGNYLHEGFNSGGLYLSEIRNYSVHDNRLANLSTGMYAKTYTEDLMTVNTPVPNYVFNNTITGCSMYGAEITSTVGGQLYRNRVDDCQSGLWISKVKGAVLESNRISNCMSGLLVDSGVGGMITLRNETYVSNTNDVDLSEVVSVDCVNCAMNRSRLAIEAFCQLTTKWYVNVTVKDCLGAPRPGANLKVKTLYGVLTANATTDAGGRCEWLVVTQNIQKSNGNFTQSPTTFEAIYGNHTGTLQTTVTGTCELALDLTNGLPVVQDVRLLPLAPFTQDNLSVSYAYTDPEADGQSGTQFSWYRNGVLYPAANGSSQLDAKYTKKGEVWFCSVVPSDGIGLGHPYNSTSVLVQNSKPWVSDIRIYPTEPDTSMSLYCNYTYNDADGDMESGTVFRWYRKNATDPDYVLRSTTFDPNLKAGITNKNDLWRCGIIPKDGEEWGTECISDSVHTNNTPPSITKVTVQPQDPTSDEDLGVSYAYNDTDMDLESGSTYQWFVHRGAGSVLGHQGRMLPKALTLKGDVWWCLVTPSDSQADGKPVKSTNVTIGNSAPTINGLKIVPQTPSADQDLSVSYNYSDPDQDLENGTFYEWEIKDNATGEFVKLGQLSRMLRASQSYSGIIISKGDVIRCRVQPNDGSQTFGQEVISPEVVIANSPPRLSGVALTPSPSRVDDLRVHYNYTDPDGDAMAAMHARWYTDGERVTELDDRTVINKDALVRGQVWTCSVQVTDGIAWTSWVDSAQVTVQNAPPAAFNISLDYPPNPSGLPLSTDDLTAHFQYSDPDQDPMNGTIIRWYQNGVHVPAMDQQMTLWDRFTNKTDIWYFTLQVFDGYDLSAEYESKKQDIGNGRPVIEAADPDNSTVSMFESHAMEFSVDVLEPDSDTLTYTWYLNSQIVGPNGGHFTFAPDYSDAGSYVLNVSIMDSGGYAFTVYRQWAIEVKNLDRAPQITGFAPEKDLGKVSDVVMFKIDYSDLDADDQMQVIWYFDDEVAQRGKDTYTFYPSEGTPGKHVIRAVVSDGHNTTEHSWGLTIPPSSKTSGPLGITWDKWGFIVQILVICLSAILGLLGIYTLRKRQGLISKYVEQMKKVYEDNRPTPDNGLKEMKKVYEEVLDLYEKRKISDSHFLVLERNYDNYVGLLRKYIIMDIDKLNAPAALKGQIQSILKDGKVTEKELTMFKKSVLASDMSKAKKLNLISVMDSWAHHDKKVEERERNIRERMAPPPAIPGSEDEEEGTEDVDLTEEEEQQIAALFGNKQSEPKVRMTRPLDAPPPPEAEERPFEDDEGILDDEDVDLTPGKRVPKKKGKGKSGVDPDSIELEDWEDDDDASEDPEKEEKGMFDPERYAPGMDDLYPDGEEEDGEDGGEDDE